MTDLSVVLISKNQEWNIARLVESVLKETNPLPSKEIVLVDSASTDRTTEIASKYPIKVLKLLPEQRLTPAAGRYVGYKQTAGDLILFLDGDMELCKGWLEKALSVMQIQSDVAVVCGLVIDRPKGFINQETADINDVDANTANIDVPHGGGAALYRRSALNEVGSFNPFLYADEEPALCLRIRHAGHRIVRLQRPSVFHYSVPFHSFSTFLDKRSNNFFLGFGQNIRYFFGSPLLWAYLRERSIIMPAIAFFLWIFTLIVFIVTRQLVWLGLLVAFITVLIMAITIKKRNLKGAFFTIFGRLLVLEGCLHGMFLKPYDHTLYSGRFDVIQ